MAEPAAIPIDVADDPALEARTLRRVRRRLLPFLCLLYFVAYLDRVNVGFASLQAQQRKHKRSEKPCASAHLARVSAQHIK